MTRLVLLAALLFACSKKKENPGPPCDQVVDKMLLLTQQMIPGHAPGSLGDRDQMIEQCKQRNMSAKVRSCIVAAQNLDDLSKCHDRKRPATDKPAGAPTPAPPAPAGPPPTGSSGSGSG